MLSIKETFRALLEAGCSFTYAAERFRELSGGGHPYPSPTRTLPTPNGELVEELIQPVLEPVSISAGELQHLQQLAALWPAFAKAQLELIARARRGELDEACATLVRATTTANEWQLADTNPGYSILQPFLRLDAIRTPEGIKVIDINSTRPAGLGDLIAYHEAVGCTYSAFLQPLPSAQIFTRTVQQCLDEWAANQRLAGEAPPVHLVIPRLEGDYRNFATLAAVLRRSGLVAQVIEPDDLPRGVPNAVIRGRIKEGHPAFETVRQGYPGERCVMAPLYRRCLGSKLWMYLVHLPAFRYFFTERLGQQGYDTLTASFAETGLVQHGRVLLPGNELDLMALDRKQWVLKDPCSSSAKRMGLGYSMGKQKWQEYLQEVASRNGDLTTVAHRFYTSVEERLVAGPGGEPTPAKLFTKYGLYFFGGTLGGIEYNARPSPVVHGARNTYFNAVYSG